MRTIFSWCVALIAGALMFQSSWAQDTVLIEDDFNGIASGDVFPTGDGVGQWAQGNNAIPGGVSWQSNQTGPQAPTSDGAGNITMVCNATWDQYIDNRNFGAGPYDNAQDTYMLAFITANNADMWFGFAGASFEGTRYGAGIFTSSGKIFFSNQQDGTGTDTLLTVQNNLKFAIKVTRLAGGQGAKIAKHNGAGGFAAAKNPLDAGWVDSGVTYRKGTGFSASNVNIMFNSIGGNGSVIVDYVRQGNLPASGPTPTPSPTPIPTPTPPPGFFWLEDFNQAAGDMPAQQEPPNDQIPIWRWNETTGDMNHYTGAGHLQMPIGGGAFHQYIDTRNYGASFDAGTQNTYFFLCVFTMPAEGMVAMGHSFSGSWNEGNTRVIVLRGSDQHILFGSPGHPSWDPSGALDTNHTFLPGVPQSLKIETDPAGAMKVFYFNGIQKDAAAANWVNISPNGMPTFPFDSNEVGINIFGDASTTQFDVDAIGIGIKGESTTPPPNASRHWTMY